MQAKVTQVGVEKSWGTAVLTTFETAGSSGYTYAMAESVMATRANNATIVQVIEPTGLQHNRGGHNTEAPTAEQHQQEQQVTLTLRLRPRPSVTWGEDVINNEGMGRKSSKRECAEAHRCSFHRQNA